MDQQKLENIILPIDYDISRVNMTGTQYVFDNPKNKSKIKPIIISNFNFVNFKKDYEARIVFLEDKDFSHINTVAEKILRIITSQKYRAGSIKAINLEKYKKQFVENINYFISKNKPICFVIPIFPFKIRNPLKSTRGDADFAEVASFCKFNEISLQIKRIYAPGAQFHIFHDGHLYYRHFLHSKSDADQYFSSLKHFVDELKINDVIKIKDAFEELQKFNDFSQTYAEAREEMENFWLLEKNTNKRIIAIRKSSRDNINISNISEKILIEINTKNDKDLPNNVQLIKSEIYKKADACALEYMVVQHALEKFNLFSKSIPNSIRMTIHPKEGQIGIYLVKKTTFLLPWMGVGILKRNGESSVRYEIEVKNNLDFTPVFVEGEKYPFYYAQN